MKDFSRRILQTGTEQEEKPAVMVETNDLSAFYETGCLRYIRSGDVEVLRMIYPAVRDRYWGTIQPIIRQEKIVQEEDYFSIKCQAEYRQGDINFRADYLINGKGNRISFEMKGEALSDFFKNRIGLCVLHSLSVSGKTCKLHYTDGKRSPKSFPELVSPHQPFMNLKGMEWEYMRGGKAILEFSGDIFETEDQRNWTDASYKTYSTPLGLPFPVKVETGFYMEQSVSLTVNDVLQKTGVSAKIHEIRIPETTGADIKLPEIGICASGEHRGFTKDELNTLRQLNFSHYRIEVCLYENGWGQKLEELVKEACLLEKPVELALCLYEMDELQGKKIKEILDRNKCELYSIACYHPEWYFTTGYILNTVYPLIRHLFPRIPLGAGSNANFAELNRNRFDCGKADFVIFPVCPQVHATDDLTIVENLEGQKHAVGSTINYFPGLPVHISPITLKKRFNTLAAVDNQSLPGSSLPVSVDPRQMSMFCAGWTLGSIKMLAEAGISSVTFYETVGMKGIICGERNTDYTNQFYTLPDMIYPVWYLLREILLHRDWKIISVHQHAPVSACILILGYNDERFVAVANLRQENNQVKVRNLPEKIEIFNMDENTYPDLLDHPQDIRYIMENTADCVIELNIKPYGLSLLKFRK